MKNTKTILEKSDIYNKLDAAFQSGSRTILLNLQNKKITEINKEVIKFAQEKTKGGIFVTFNEPAAMLANEINQTEKKAPVFFIDCVSKKKEKKGNIIYISNPKSLTELSIEITKLTRTGQFDFFCIDSLSTLLIYNDSEMTGKFIYFITNKMKILGIKSVLIISDKENKEKIKKLIEQICDQCIEL